MEFISYPQLVPVVMATVQLIKMLFAGKKGADFVKRIAPLMSLLFALILSIAIYGVNVEVIINGLITGLTASGIYSGSKSLLNIKK